eukprot:481749_1
MDEPHVDMSVRRDMSVELFHPSFSDPSRQVGVMNTAWILMCTVLGGSILSLPYAIHCCGLVPGMLLLLLTGAAADSSIYTLTSCSRRSGKETFTEIMEVAFGHQVKLIACIMFVMVTFVPLVAYTILLRDLSWPLILKSPGERMLSPNLLMILLVMVIAPACIVKGISSVQVWKAPHVCLLLLTILPPGFCICFIVPLLYATECIHVYLYVHLCLHSQLGGYLLGIV